MTQPNTTPNPYGTPQPPQAPTPPKRHRKGLTIAAVIAGVLVVLAVGVGIGSAGDQKPTAAAAPRTAPVPTAAPYTPPVDPSDPDGDGVQDTTPPPAEPTSDTSKEGDVVPVGTDDGEIAGSVQVVTATTYKRPKSTYGDAPQHGTYLVIDVLVKVTAGTLPFNPFDWQYQAPDGTVYGYGDGNAIFAGFDPELDSGDLSAGQKVRGKVTLDVKYAPGGTVQYNPVGTIVAQWSV